MQVLVTSTSVINTTIARITVLCDLHDCLMLEKEALTKGVLLGEAHDIDIPPPRPKRKPSNPYPRKTAVTAPISSSVGSKDGKPVAIINSLNPSKQVLDLENYPPAEEPPVTATCGRSKQSSDERSFQKLSTLCKRIPVLTCPHQANTH